MTLFLVVQIVGFCVISLIHNFFFLLQEFWAGLYIMKSVQQLEWQEFVMCIIAQFLKAEFCI